MTILETIDTPIGSYAPDFELPGIDHQVHHLSRYLNKFRAVGVVSMCNRCPYVELYLEKLKSIQAEFSQVDFTLIGLNGSEASGDARSSLENMKAFAQSHNLNFPYLWDPTQDVTRSFGAHKTPMAFLIDSRGVVRYKGQIDASYKNPLTAAEDYLRNAIACLLQDQEIRYPETEVIGTPLIWRD
ncbi:thioredoxin family protein [Fortiea contorta]|uniref:thioredoxin family protein n=1 Tax=Fortiea contorta TaxID=1892405 RepID=UPI00034B3427|nr:thioredoxin family protein [Fortiea contorta]